MESLTNPTKRVNKPKTANGRTRRLEKGEEKRLLKNANTQLRPVITFALATAMIRTEIASLTWDNVDLKKTNCLFAQNKK